MSTEVKEITVEEVKVVDDAKPVVPKKTRDVPQIVRDLAAKPEQIQLVEVLYSSLKEAVVDVTKDQGINASNIIVIIDTAMKLVSDMQTLNGIEKKAVVMTVVKRLVDESSLSAEDKVVVDIIVEHAMDPVIDQLFAMAPQAYGKLKAGCLNLCRK